MEALKDIVVTLIEQKVIANTCDTDVNIEEVNKAINEIGKTLYDTNKCKFDK